MNRTVIYARVSTDEQILKYGIPLQLRACQEKAAALGLQVVRELSDDGISGTTLERPGLTELRRLVAAGEVDVVLSYDVDRLSRELVHLLILKPELEKRARIEFVSAKFEDSPSGRMFFGIRGVIAQYEREVMRERTSRGKKERARSGLLVGGRVAYGYRYNDGRLEPEEPRATTVREMFAAYEGGMSMRAIALKLRREGAPTWSGKKWGHSSVRRILTNETYAGIAYYGTHRREGTVLRQRHPAERIVLPVPALISREQWERVQRKIAANPTVGRPSAEYLLRGILYCSCGRRMVGDLRRRYRSYRCNGRDALRFRGGTCRCSVNAAKVDAVVWRLMVTTFTDAEFLRGILSEHERELRESEPSSRIGTLQAQLRRSRARETAALSAMLDAELVEARGQLKMHYRDARTECARLEGEIAMLERRQKHSVAAGEWLEDAVAMLRGYIPSLNSPEERQGFIRGVLTRAEWDGRDLRLECFIGRESVRTSTDCAIPQRQPQGRVWP